MARAALRPDGRYLASPPAPVGALDDLWKRLGAAADAVLLGVDFPLGVPAAYAARAGIGDFVAELPRFGTGIWRDFYQPAATPAQVSLSRPFYPDRPGGCRRAHLVAGLGLADWSALYRRCDHRTPSRRAACPLFWTLGGSQVGKAAISGWRDLLAPALHGRPDVALWPFHGTLEALLRQHRFVVAETYPGEVYGHLGLELRARGGKRSPLARRANADRMLAWAAHAGVSLEPELRTAIETGFGAITSGEDAFDAVVGLFGLLEVVRGMRPSGEPDDPIVRRVEGWILGQTPDQGETTGDCRGRRCG